MQALFKLIPGKKVVVFDECSEIPDESDLANFTGLCSSIGSGGVVLFNHSIDKAAEVAFFFMISKDHGIPSDTLVYRNSMGRPIGFIEDLASCYVSYNCPHASGRKVKDWLLQFDMTDAMADYLSPNALSWVLRHFCS